MNENGWWSDRLQLRAQWSEARDYLMMNDAARLLSAVARKHEKERCSDQYEKHRAPLGGC